jgi:hypothetical protein
MNTLSSAIRPEAVAKIDSIEERPPVDWTRRRAPWRRPLRSDFGRLPDGASQSKGDTRLRRVTRFVLSAAVAAGVAALALPAQADPPQRILIETPISGVGFNECTAENLFIQGILTIDQFFHYDSSGGFHFSAHPSVVGTAVGMSSGNTYRYMDRLNESDEINLGNNSQIAFTFVENAPLVSQGSPPNLMMRLNSHVTIDANGNITVIRTDFTADCRG